MLILRSEHPGARHGRGPERRPRPQPWPIANGGSRTSSGNPPETDRGRVGCRGWHAGSRGLKRWATRTVPTPRPPLRLIPNVPVQPESKPDAVALNVQVRDSKEREQQARKWSGDARSHQLPSRCRSVAINEVSAFRRVRECPICPRPRPTRSAPGKSWAWRQAKRKPGGRKSGPDKTLGTAAQLGLLVCNQEVEEFDPPPSRL